MRPSRKVAMDLWNQRYGNRRFAKDFHGNLMFKDAYGDPEFSIVENGERVYCGWNLHHILPSAFGGSNKYANLLCTNIATNEAAGDKITFWIDDDLYQVHRDSESDSHIIVRLT